MTPESILDGVLKGSIDTSTVVDAIKSASSIKIGETTICLSEFVPWFLGYLHEKLSPKTIVPQQNSLNYSQRKYEKATNVVKQTTKQKTSFKTSSSPVKKHVSQPKCRINEISPIKKSAGNDTSRRQKTTFIRPQPSHGSNSKFELSSFDDFPSMSSVGSTPTKNPRRITATPVCFGKSSLSLSNTQDSFLGESNFEISYLKDNTLNQLFADDKRFTKALNNNNSNEDGCFDSNSGLDDAFKRLNLSNNKTNSFKNSAITKVIKKVLSVDMVVNHGCIDSLVLIYSTIFSRNIISNYSLELNFLFAVLTYPENTNTNISFPFTNVAGCVYFASQCLHRFKTMLVLLDKKTIQMLLENERLSKFLDQEIFDFIESNVDYYKDNSMHQLIIKSPMTGIPFQTEFDNRNNFNSDQLFYSFSKKRDLFYALVRLWEENHLDPEWNMKNVLTQKVNDILKTQGDINVYYPLARLFVAQLIEMCRNKVGSNADSETTNNISDNVILELKTKNPSKFENLQNRFTEPSISYDPCPKPSFSMVEEFFKEFISLSDSYCFNKFLIHVILTKITIINCKSFGLNHSFNLDKSDFAESTWLEIKSAITELRLLAKFLGYIIFLPYKSCSLTNSLSIQDTRMYTTEPIDMCVFMNKAVTEKRLIITIPWVVDFFSMADKNVFKIDFFHQPLVMLIKIYRQTKICCKSFSILHLLLITHIGWLLEQPHVEGLDFFKISLLNEVSATFQTDVGMVGIDDIVNIDKEFLYDICPYLNDIKKPLRDYAKGLSANSNGSYRKITTVKTSDIFFNDSILNLRVQLIDNFLKYQPTNVTDCLQFITERHCNNIKSHLSSTIFPACAQQVLDEIKDRMSLDLESSEPLEVQSIKLHNQSLYEECLTSSESTVAHQSHQYLKSYLKEKLLSSVQSLLPDNSLAQIIETSTKVVQYNIQNKIQEWLKGNKNIYTSLVEALYQKYVKSIVKISIDQERCLKYHHSI